jgi:hypothetical protein
VAGDRPDFVCSAAGFGQASGCGLSQAMCGAMRKPRPVTFAPEPMSEGRRRERAADPGRQECQMAARRCSDNTASINLTALIDELRKAIAVLEADTDTSPPPTRARPVLRLIEGGLSKN